MDDDTAQEATLTVKAWKCEVCGYVHQGNEPPDVCPVCGVGPESFSQIEIVAEARPDEPGAVAADGRAWRCTVCDHVHEGREPPEGCPVCGMDADLFEAVAGDDGGVRSEAGASGGAGQRAKTEHLVIVGAGIAGITAAEHARRTAVELAISIVSKEPDWPYYRLNLTRYLAGEVERDALRLHDRGWLQQQRVDLIDGEAVSIDRAGRQLLLRDGCTVAYDRLILAHGAHSFIPPIPGATREGVLGFRTLADADAIGELAAPGRRAVVVGGGLLGLETAGALVRRGVAVTVLEGFSWLLPRQLPEPAGQLLAAHLEQLGIVVRCGVKLKEILGDEQAAGVRLADGGEIAAELVVVAAGVRPNSYLARQSGLAVEIGVVVDDRMTSSDPAIYAAGDVAEHRGVLYGIWPASYAEGVVAGINAAGGRAEFTGLPPANSLKVLDVDLLSVGLTQPQDGSYELLERQPRAGVYQRYVCRDGRLVGAVLYGDTALARQVREAIERGAQVVEMPALLADVPGLAAACGARVAQA